MKKNYFRKLFSMLFVLFFTISFSGCMPFMFNSIYENKYPKAKIINIAKKYIKDKYSENLQIETIEENTRGTVLGVSFEGYTIRATDGYYIDIAFNGTNDSDDLKIKDSKQSTEIENAVNNYLENNLISNKFHAILLNSDFSQKYTGDIKSFLNEEPKHSFNIYFKYNGNVSFEQFTSEYKKIKDDLQISGHAVVLNPEIYDKLMDKLDTGDNNITKSLTDSTIINYYLDNFYLSKYTTEHSNNLINYSDGIKIGLLNDKDSEANLNFADITFNKIKLNQNYSIKTDPSEKSDGSHYEILSDIYQINCANASNNDELNIIIDSSKLLSNISITDEIVIGEINIYKNDPDRFEIKPRHNFSFDSFTTKYGNDVFVDENKLSFTIYNNSHGFVLMRKSNSSS